MADQAVVNTPVPSKTTLNSGADKGRQLRDHLNELSPAEQGKELINKASANNFRDVFNALYPAGAYKEEGVKKIANALIQALISEHPPIEVGSQRLQNFSDNLYKVGDHGQSPDRRDLGGQIFNTASKIADTLVKDKQYVKKVLEGVYNGG